MTEKPIENGQLKLIHGLARELGVSVHDPDGTDDLHTLAAGLTGKTSLRSLSHDEAEQLIGELKHRIRFGFSPLLQENPGGITSGQRKKILALMCEMRKLDSTPSKATIEQRVAGIIRRELHISSVASAPYAWLTYKDGSHLIDIIKKYLEHAQARQAKG